jgi:hypothetical protein
LEYESHEKLFPALDERGRNVPPITCLNVMAENLREVAVNIYQQQLGDECSPAAVKGKR